MASPADYYAAGLSPAQVDALNRAGAGGTEFPIGRRDDRNAQVWVSAVAAEGWTAGEATEAPDDTNAATIDGVAGSNPVATEYVGGLVYPGEIWPYQVPAPQVKSAIPGAGATVAGTDGSWPAALDSQNINHYRSGFWMPGESLSQGAIEIILAGTFEGDNPNAGAETRGFEFLVEADPDLTFDNPLDAAQGNTFRETHGVGFQTPLTNPDTMDGCGWLMKLTGRALGFTPTDHGVTAPIGTGVQSILWTFEFLMAKGGATLLDPPAASVLDFRRAVVVDYDTDSDECNWAIDHEMNVRFKTYDVNDTKMGRSSGTLGRQGKADIDGAGTFGLVAALTAWNYSVIYYSGPH